MSSQLDELKKMTTVVIDTGDIDSVKKYAPVDATTNPSLVYAASKQPQYRSLVEEARAYAKAHAKSTKEERHLLILKLFVNFGVEILKFVPGRVSTEVDARLSFDVEGSVQTAHELIRLYQEAGVPRERILIKLASTWEGFQAAKQLEKEKIHTNMTLMFSLEQAICAAEAGATLISPFVGRILDWYKKSQGVPGFAPAEDPGVQSVTLIYNYLKKYGYSTQVMGASFRNTDEITELAGCDLLTISPQLLEALSISQAPLPRKLSPKNASSYTGEKLSLSEKAFRYALNDNAMATEKLAEGIRGFVKDTLKLEQEILGGS